MAKTISTEELKQKIDNKEDFVLVDALAENSYEARHIPGAINVPNSPEFLQQFEEKAGVPKDKEIITYCSSATCMASVQAAETLEEEKPRPPFPAQRQDPPGLDEEMNPRPLYQGKSYKPAGKLEGKVALITGGDSGIGRAVAFVFAREGADVAVVHLQAEERDAMVIKQEIEKLGKQCISIVGDIADSAFCNQAVRQTVQELGGLDILVNNAAIMPQSKNIEQVLDEDIDRSFKVNIYSYFYMSRAAAPHMKPGSCIINTGSIVGSRGGDDLLVYSTTKGAVHTFTKSLAKELLPRGIRVNCVSPGPVWTPLQPAYKFEEQVVHFGAHNPMGRPGQPEELAPAFVFLASSADSSYISGEIIFVVGGDVAR